MKLVPTTGKASLGYKHLKGQAPLSDFGFISACPLQHQTNLDAYLHEEKKRKQEGN